MTLLRFACILALALINGCAGADYPSGPAAEVVAVEGVRITPQVVQLAPGQVFQLTATVVPTNATQPGLRWESTDPAVASVDSVGRVTAKGVGSGVYITVYAEHDRFQSTANVSVFVADAPGNRHAGALIGR